MSLSQSAAGHSDVTNATTEAISRATMYPMPASSETGNAADVWRKSTKGATAPIRNIVLKKITTVEEISTDAPTCQWYARAGNQRWRSCTRELFQRRRCRKSARTFVGVFVNTL